MFGWFRTKKGHVEFDEIFLDASNLPAFNRERMEGRIELPIMKRNVFVVGAVFLLVACGFLGKLFSLQVAQGSMFADISEHNRFDEALIIAERGVIYDRHGELLAWNEHDFTNTHSFPTRAYTKRDGLGQVIGYVSYPQKDTRGYYYRTEYIGRTGSESAYDETLRGENGHQVIEVDAINRVVGEHVTDSPTPGKEVTLSIDAALTEAMFAIIATSSAKAGFQGGTGAIMDVTTGEIIAMASYPSYDPQVMANGSDVAQIEAYNNDTRNPFLNKVIGGEFTPGSIVKPFVAYAALVEKIISPDKIIVSNGELIVPNRFTPSQPARFGDWRVHGPMDMREAIAFSSNVYFYQVGGGFGNQPGLGITKINEYMNAFGFGEPTGIEFGTERVGTVPNPEWKAEVFDDDWRLGDTYNTSIGQYGWQVTPLQAVRATAALANGGKLFTPHLEKDQVGEYEDLELDPWALNIINEGMYMTTYYPGGTARGLERKDVKIAAKSGTAEIGAGNAFVNSLAIGFFPYDEPKYAFVLLMERAPRSNTLGATTIMGDVVRWIREHRPEYLDLEPLPPENSTQ